ncbi:MAG: NAD-dependent epimerase/dehydratase family protein [Anaerolineae bacterium]
MGSDTLTAYPWLIEDEATLDEVLSRPSPRLIEAMGNLQGDLMILGVGGKMGPSLARLAKRAGEAAGVGRRVIGVSRFSQPEQRRRLEDWGIETVSCDLMDQAGLDALPEAENIVFMAGRKFGSTGAEAATWAMNAYLPGLVARRFPRSRFVIFSSGNIYHLTPIGYGGATESDPASPVGEYAQSVLARERLFEYFSRELGTPVTTVRLNYAIDLRYGVLYDVAQKVFQGQPVDVTMGHANVIWQGDANAAVLQAFSLCATPPAVMNLTGPEIVSVRWAAQRFAEHFGKPATIVGTEAPTALLSNAAHCFSLFGYPTVALETMIRWIAHWMQAGGTSLGKPTHFETRDGKF